MVAALIRLPMTCCTQPASRATRIRRTPSAGKTCGLIGSASRPAGASRAIRPSLRGRSVTKGEASLDTRSTTLNRCGYGRMVFSTQRVARSIGGRS